MTTVTCEMFALGLKPGVARTKVGRSGPRRPAGVNVSHPAESTMRYPTHRLEALANLSPAEVTFLQALGDPPVRQRRGVTFRHEGDAASGFFFLLDGWVSSSVLLRSGKRLVQKVHLPGDMLGTPSMALEESAICLQAITHATTAFVPFRRLSDLFTQQPRLAALFAIAIQMERIALMDALAASGRASAREQMARFLLDLEVRLVPLGLVEDNTFELPLTQEVIGDLLGLTAIHVNQIIRSMEGEGLITRDGHRFTLADVAALRRISPLPARKPRFEPDWLPARS